VELESVIVENLTKTFNLKKPKGISNIAKNLKSQSQESGKLVALDNISFKVSKGEVLGIIGLNGSGKTTLLRIIAGIYMPTSGMIQVNGRLAPLLQIATGFNQELVARENIVLYGMLLGIPKSKIEQKVDSIIEFAELEKFSEMKLLHYSSGMSARLAFSTALEIDPDILLIDEILAVGDIAFKEKSFDAILSFKKKGKTILFTSHSKNMISKLADRALLLQRGKLVTIGKTEEVIKQYDEIAKNK